MLVVELVILLGPVVIDLYAQHASMVPGVFEIPEHWSAAVVGSSAGVCRRMGSMICT